MSADELGIGDDWLSAVDEWDSRLDLPTAETQTPLRPTPAPPRAAPPPRPVDPLMDLLAADADVELTGEGEALGPGLGLDPAPPMPALTVAEPRPGPLTPPSEELLDQLLSIRDHERGEDFDDAPTTRAMPEEELRRLMRPAEAPDFSTVDTGETTAVAGPDGDLLGRSRSGAPEPEAGPAAGGRRTSSAPVVPAAEAPPPPVAPPPVAAGAADDDFYAEVEIDRSEAPRLDEPPMAARTPLPGGLPRVVSRPTMVSRPVTQRPAPPAPGVAEPGAPRHKTTPLVSTRSSRLVDDLFGVEIGGETVTVTPAAAPGREPSGEHASEGVFGRTEAGAEVRLGEPEASPGSLAGLGTPAPDEAAVFPVAREGSLRFGSPRPSAPVEPRAAELLDLGPEPARPPPLFQPPPLDWAALALALPEDAASGIEAAAWTDALVLVRAERALHPEDTDLMASEARLLDRTERTTEAESLWRAAADSGSLYAGREMVRRCLRRGQLGEVLDWIDQYAERAAPGERTALALFRSALLGARRDPEAARRVLETAVAAAGEGGGTDALALRLGLLELDLAAGRDAEALGQLEAITSEDPTYLAALRTEQGRLAERLGDDVAARAAYDQAVSTMPDLGAAAAGRTRVTLRQGDRAAHIGACAAEADCAPACTGALRRRAGILAFAAGEPGRALALLGSIDSALALASRAEVAQALGSAEDAAAAFAALAEREADPVRQAAALARAGEIQEARGDADGAAALYERALEIAPSFFARRGLERTNAEHADPMRRIAALAAAAAGDPERAPLLHTRAARLYEQAGRIDEARGALAQALTLAPAFGPALAELAALETAAGQSGPLGDALELAAAAEPPERAALFGELAAEAAGRAGDPARAARRLRDAAGLEGAPRPLRWAALAGDPALLDACAEEAEDPAFGATLHHRRALLLLERGEPARAEEALRAALAQAPLHPGAHADLCELLLRAGRLVEFAEALRARCAAAGSRPEAVALLLRTAGALEEAGEGDRAISAWAEAEALAPGFGPVVQGLLHAARAEGDLERAARLAVAQADGAGSLEARAALLALAAVAYERRGDTALAARCYSDSLEAASSDLVAHARRELYLRTGDFSALTQTTLAELREIDDPAAKVRAYRRLAEIDARERGEPASAVLAYESLLAIDPVHQPTLRALERSLLEPGREADLAALYERLAASVDDPRVAVALLSERARLRDQLEGPAAALSDYRAVLARDPHALPALLPLLAEARDSGDAEHALELHLHLSEAVAEDPRASAACLFRAGDALVLLGREAEALDRYRAAADLEPDHLPVQLYRLWAALRAEHWQDAARAAEALSRAAHDPALGADWGLVGAVLAEEQLADGEGAIRTLRRVVELDPQNESAFVRLRRTLEAAGRWEDLFALLEVRVGRETEAWRVIDLQLALAEIARLHLANPDRARSHLGEVVRLHPTNLGAMRQVVELDLVAGRWAEAAETLLRAARLERDPARLRDVFFRLGVIYADHLPDAKKAAAAFGHALVHAPKDREVVLRLSDLFLREKDWQNALSATARLCDLETTPEAKIEWLLRQADILRQGFGDVRHAAAALRRAADLDPRDLRPTEALAELFANDPASRRVYLDRAIAGMRQALRKDPFDLGAWSALVRIFDWHGSPDCAHAAALAVDLLSAPGADAHQAILAHRGRTFAPLGAPLGEPAVQELLFPAAIPAGFRNLFGMIEEPLAKGLRLDLRRLGVDRRSRLGKTSPFAHVMARLAREMGLPREVELYASETQPTVCVLDPGDSAVLVVGAALLRDAEEAELRFLAGRALFLLRTHMALPARLGEEELGLLVGGIVAQFIPDYVHPSLAQTALHESAQRIGKLLPRKQREPIMPFALECSGLLDFATLCRAVAETGDRAGLLCSGDLAASVRVLGRAAGLPPLPPRGEPLLRALRGTRAIEDLIRFLGSEELGEIRRQLS